MPSRRGGLSALPAAFEASRTRPFQHGEIIEKAAAAGFGQAATGMRPVAFIAFGDLHEAGLLQHLEVPAQIAVGQAAKLPEIGESQAFRMRHQRGQQPSLAFSWITRSRPS